MDTARILRTLDSVDAPPSVPELVAWVRELIEAVKNVTCPFCGDPFRVSSEDEQEELQTHVLSCVKNPAGHIDEDIKTALRALRAIVREDDGSNTRFSLPTRISTGRDLLELLEETYGTE